MKKDTFIKGAFISTLCIIISKILGIIYVIPFHAIIGEQGGALYSYAYNIYALFLNLSTVGIPLAISKIVSEYNALNYHDAKKRAYRIAMGITSITAIVSTIILLVFAYPLAQLIKGGVEGGNSLEDIAFVIRVSASAILFVTILSNMRGYLQGQKYIKDSSISQVVEQFVRIVVILAGSFVFIRLYGIKEAVGIAVFGATISAIFALLYLYFKAPKELSLKRPNNVLKEEEKITNSYLTKKIITYTIPFIIMSIIVSLYNSIDMVTVIKTLVNTLHYPTLDAEYVMSCIATWGAKLNVIVTSIASGLVVSLLPNITSDYALKNYEGIRNKTIKTLQILLILVIPMVTGLSFLSEPVWTVFYGNNPLGSSVFKMSIFTALFSSLFLNLNVIMQSVNRYKQVYVSLSCGLLFKIIFNIPFMILFDTLNMPAYYGASITTILGYIVSITMNLIDLRKLFNISYKSTFKTLCFTLLSTIIMVIVLSLINLIIPFTNLTRINSILLIIIYAVIGSIIYFTIMWKTGNLDELLGKYLKKIFKRKES